MNNAQFLKWCQSRARPDRVESFFGYQRTPLIMGILNVTPDSFSDAGQYFTQDKALARAKVMISEGASIIDVGGESSRPFAARVSLDEELSRVIPVIERLRQATDVCISIDTYKPEVMKAAVQAGAGFINDIKALREPGALDVALTSNVPVCLMHMQGAPHIMQQNPQYAGDVVDEIHCFFQDRVAACVSAGMPQEHLVLDPGFGFGKTVSHNLEMVRRFREFQRHQLPMLIGVSRKSTLGTVLQKPVEDRLIGSLVTEVMAALQGVSIIRTHDVLKTKEALLMLDAISSG